jgi:hypothetical protein
MHRPVILGSPSMPCFLPQGIALTVGLAAARHLDDVWAVLDQFGRSTPIKWSLHSSSPKVTTRGSRQGSGTLDPTLHEGQSLQTGTPREVRSMDVEPWILTLILPVPFPSVTPPFCASVSCLWSVGN